MFNVKDLKKAISIAKDLQVELQRLQIAIDRRKEKAVNKWENELKIVREQHIDANKKVSVFNDKLREEIRVLTEQKKKLIDSDNEKVQKFEIEKAKQECDKKLRRVMKQLQIDERLTFEKMAASKEEAMKKHIAEKEFAPILDKVY